MSENVKVPGGLTLAEMLPVAQRGGFGIGAFSARYVAFVRPIVEAAAAANSPFIVENSQREFGWFETRPADYRFALEEALAATGTRVPFALHLDHSWDFELIKEAIAAGFTSVMIDASAFPFEENVERTREVVSYAHPRGVSVEAELGKLTTTDKLETVCDEEMYTDPAEAELFVKQTGCDILAASVGTAHGVYMVKDPKIDFERLAEIRRRLPDTPLVLHGGSGLPPKTVRQAIALPGGGISKMNVATDLENAMLNATGEKRMTSAAFDALSPDLRARGLAAVRAEVTDKIENYLMSAGRAWPAGR
ncbi:MAG TPA: class II fructose-bisphosphate aldolase [Deinococcales bacterium]|nr:class II fructose-bisphosphate aldolase [Deinococcales bacterium]